MRRKLLAILLVLLMTVAVFSACTTTQPESAGDAGTSQEEAAKDDTQEKEDAQSEAKTEDSGSGSGAKLKIGVSINALANIHNRQVFENTQEAAKAAGHEVVATNANGLATQQAADIENLIQQQCDVIIIQNGDTDALRNVVLQASEKGIYTISMDSGWIPGISSMFAKNDFEIGAELYTMMAAEMGYEGECILINHNDHTAIRSRRNVQEAVLREYTGITIANTVTSTFPGTIDAAYSGVESALQANPNVSAIWCTFDLEALGAAQACKALGRDDIVIVGVDGELDALRIIKEGGPIIATVVGDMTWASEEVIKVAECIVNGDYYKKFNSIPFTVVTENNVDEFLAAAEANAAAE